MRPDLDPSQLTHDECLDGVAAILAAGLLRLRDRAALGAIAPSTPDPEDLVEAVKEPLAVPPEQSVTVHAGYPKETVVAEKVEAMVKLGLANSRMKDFYDLLVMARSFSFDGQRVREAIRATFERRGTAMPTAAPVALTDTFWKDDAKQKQWKAFVKRSGLEKGAGELSEVVAKLSLFVLPPVMAVSKGEVFTGTWQPSGTWS
ncbi:MAG: nucleotidyl transferase AbiEii/AbiGii toxin family protein [Gemmataceae bacterium]